MTRARPGRRAGTILCLLALMAPACDDERETAPAEQPAPDAGPATQDAEPLPDLEPAEDATSDAGSPPDSGQPEDSGGPPTGCELWVAEGAAAGGDGTVEHPLPTVAAALEVVDPDCTVHLAKGLYRLPSRITPQGTLRIEGTAQMYTIIEGPEAGAGAWVDGRGALELERATLRAHLDLHLPRVQLRHLSLRGLDAGLRIGPGETLDVGELTAAGSAGVHIDSVKQVTVAGARFEGPQARLRLVDIREALLDELSFTGVAGPALVLQEVGATLAGLILRDIGDNPDDAELGGDGLVVKGGGLDLQRVELEGVSDRGLVFDGAVATVSGVAASDAGRGLLMVLAGSEVHVRESTFADAGVLLYANGAKLQVDDCALSRGSTAGLLGGQGAIVQVSDSSFTDCPQGHISLLGAGSAGTFERNVFREAAAASCVSVSHTAGPLRVRDNTVQGCAGGGIDAMQVVDLEITGNELSDIRFDVLFGTVANAISLIDARGRVASNDILDSLGTGISTLRAVAQIESNRIGPVDSSGISVVDPSPEPTVVANNTIVRAVGTGVVVLNTLAEVRDNHIEGTLRDPSAGLGDGIAFGMGGDVLITGNSCEGSVFNGIIFMDGAHGAVRGNHLQGNGMYGVMEFCMAGLAANEVEVSDNTFEGNRLGEVERCAQ